MQFTLKQRSYFVVAGEAGSILRAAENIHVSQPSISNAIGHLQDVFQIQLFIRHHAQSMSLTTAGSQIMDQAKALLRDAIVMVAPRIGSDSLWQELSARENEWEARGIKSIKIVGDAQSPAPIAWATYAGHRYACELDMPDLGDGLPFRREVAQLKND